MSEKQTLYTIYYHAISANLWIQENIGLIGLITTDYCGMNSITLDCENIEPKPVYPEVEPEDPILQGMTTFQISCVEAQLMPPSEYTCNFDDPLPYTKAPVAAPLFGGRPEEPFCGTPPPGR